MLFRQFNVMKDLHAMGLKASNIQGYFLLFLAMVWVYFLYDDEVKIELLELCREGEEFSSLIDPLESNTELFDAKTATLLLNLRFSCLEFSMFPVQHSARIITHGLDWGIVDPKIALDMLHRGFARPGFLRKTNLAYFTWAYFHAFLNEAQIKPWRLLTRKLFAGAGPEEVALPPCLSQSRLPLLCGTLSKIKWRQFSTGAFNKWLSKVLLMWTQDLAEAGVDLQEYFRIELSACRGTDMQLRPGTRLLESGPSLVVLNYGENPQDWIFEWDPCVEGAVGEFWKMVEFPPMPGAWMDEYSDDEDDGESRDGLNYKDCQMGGSVQCTFVSFRYWGEIQRSGVKLDSLGVRGIPLCTFFQHSWFS